MRKQSWFVRLLTRFVREDTMSSTTNVITTIQKILWPFLFLVLLLFPPLSGLCSSIKNYLILRIPRNPFSKFPVCAATGASPACLTADSFIHRIIILIFCDTVKVK